MSEEKCQKCWNGEYPLFIEWGESMQMEFVDDEEELVEFCTLQHGNSIMGMARHPVILGYG